MGLRPARITREINKQAYTRYSKKRPRESYVKSMPHLALQITSMGNPRGAFDYQLDLVAVRPIQIRDNSLEAARQAINKNLEAQIPNAYHFFVRVYPHHVIRAVRMVFGAGADRIQKGMKHAWGRPSDRAARVYPGAVVFTARVNEEHFKLVKEGFRRARLKLPGSYRVKITKLSKGGAEAEAEAA